MPIARSPKGSSRVSRQTKGLNLKEFYYSRSETARKGDFGRVVICGGSDRYTGCLGFNALAALRAGADLAIVVAPRRAADIVAGYSPDLITVPCNSPFPDPDLTIEALGNADSLVLGCGVVRTPEAHLALIDIIKACETPMVLDAEALHALGPKGESIHGKKALLTPNIGEYRTLSGTSWPTSLEAQKASVQALAQRYEATIVVKGSLDIMSDGKEVYVDRQGSPYMTKGGYGDLLAGVAGAHLARRRTPFDAARLAAYIVGRAGALAGSKLGESTLASDVLQYLPSVIRSN